MSKQQKKINWVLIVLLLLATVTPLVLPYFWFTDIFSHFRAQYFLLLFILLPFNIYFVQSRKAIMLLILGILINGLFIFPLYVGQKSVSGDAQGTLKVACLNLLSSNSQIARVIEYLYQGEPDMIIFMEVTPKWEKALKQTFEKYQYSEVVVREDNFGIAMVSHQPIETRVHYFSPNNPSIIANLQLADDSLTVIATHPKPPVNKQQFEQRNQHLEAIAKSKDEYLENLMVIGDLNTSSYSTHFRRFRSASDLRDSRKGFGLFANMAYTL